MGKQIEAEPGNLVVVRDDSGNVQFADLVTSWSDEYGFYETISIVGKGSHTGRVKWDDSAWVEVY